MPERTSWRTRRWTRRAPDPYSRRSVTGRTAVRSATGGRGPRRRGLRKVRAPQGRVLGNAQRERSQGKGQQKTTRGGGKGRGKVETVGKSRPGGGGKPPAS